MYRTLAFCFALGLTPAFAEDAAPILDGLPTCAGSCPQPTVTAMSSDLDGDGKAEYFYIEDLEAEVTLAKADCTVDIGATCSMAIEDLATEADHRL